VYYSISRDERQAVEWDFNLLAHPVPYPALIIENSFRNGVPPHLVYEMMRQESRFDLNAVSSAGAMGLMQLMPSTGDHVAGRLGFPQGRYDRLFVPEINLTFGIWYAAHLLSRTDGDLLMMLSAYNAGLGNARRWFRSGDGSGAVVRVDGIDYGETRDYVKRIVESARVYHALYFYADTAGRDPAR
jgi:soluble lytic murein transglycosylase